MGERSWIVGSLADCDVRVESPTVSGRHCRLTQRGDGFLLEDLQSTNGTFVSNERIIGPRIVCRGDAVTLGRETPLPWSSISISITLGRSPDNDVVIPFDAVSAHHARLEREGSRVFLIDLQSTNGTAINDPLNKIKRAALEPTDHVFFGTHRLAAADLLAAMPGDAPRRGTMLERPSPEGLQRAAQTRASAAPGASAMRSPGAWAAGVALSVACLVVILGGRFLVRSRSADDLAVTQPFSDAGAESAVNVPANASAPTPPQRVVADPRRSAPEERLVHQQDEGVALLGLRIEGELLLKSVKATCWTCGASEVICPTSVLDRLEGLRKQAQGRAISLVVCTPAKTIAILSHKSGPAGFAIATLEAPLDVVCGTASGPTALAPAPGQKLAMLAGRTDSDDPRTIRRTVSYLTIDRIERGDDKAPTMFHCTCDANDPGAAAGSPVFDASGRVVGCVEVAIEKSTLVIPISRLDSILKPGS